MPPGSRLGNHCGLGSDQPGGCAWRSIRAGSLALKILIAISLATPEPASSAGSGHPPLLIDDFEAPTALQSWHVLVSPEHPSAGDALTLGPGHRGHGALLTYRLTCQGNIGCGAYAAAVFRPPSALPRFRDPAISLWIRSSPDVEVSLVIKDTSRQTLRFPIRASIEQSKADDWAYRNVPLSRKRDGEATGGIKGRLEEIDILVQGRARTSVEGSVSFDDVQLREGSETFHIDTTRAATLAAGAPPLPGRFGVNIHLLRDDHDLDLAQAAGFQFARMDMLWSNVERGGRYRFFAYDRLLRALEARGMGVLWILDYGHPDHGSGVPRTRSDIVAFGHFAEAAAAHFKGRNVGYEVWNEPNTSQFWEPAPDASEYAALLREAIAAIRGADPSAKVSTGGVSGIDQAFLSKAVDPSLAAGLTAIGIHPYPRTGPESIAAPLEMLRDWVRHTLGADIEIWDTEWGYSSTDALQDAHSNGHSSAARQIQAALAVREILTVWAVGLPLAVWYDLHDDGPDATNPEQNYGLLDSSGNEKPAMNAVRTLVGAVNGRRYAGMIQEVPEGIHAMRFEGSTDTMVAVWTDRPVGRRTIEYTKRDLISATGLMGEAIKSKDRPAGDARVEIDAAGGPIYLRWTIGSRVGVPPHEAVSDGPAAEDGVEVTSPIKWMTSDRQ
jgi:hypothetical protein